MTGSERPDEVAGRVWILADGEGRLLDDIDTDQIFHNRHLSVTDPAATGQFALGNLPGWEDFPERAEPGDLILAGSNFGSGSSRQQAVDCFLALKVGAVLARSFAPIYYRNAVNAALPVLACPGLDRLIAARAIVTGSILRIDLPSGETRRAEGGPILFRAEAAGEVQLAIYRAGGLLRYGLSPGE